MKKFTLLLTAFFLGFVIWAQAPEAFKFQTVIRDGDGNLLPNQEVTLKFTIHEDAPDGAMIYSEQHQVTTNPSGLVNLEIGNGEVLSGEFANLNWGDHQYFLEEQIDIGNTGNFQVFGTVQLLSVPYALHAKTARNGIQSMTTEERDAMENPQVGTQIYNTTTNCLNYWSGTNWFETCGDCTPQPDNAYAGPDQEYFDSTTVAHLQANPPEVGIGEWTKSSPYAGYFDDPTNPEAKFYGEHCKVYYLKWTVSTSCGSDQDNVKITFDNTPSPAFAGQDTLINSENTSITLNAETPENGDGQWSVISGTGGSFDENANPNAIFTGEPCAVYDLEWSVATECHENTDTVNVEFYAIPTMAIAGNDTTINDENLTIALNGNTPEVGTGQWSILSGEGGSFADASNPTTEFTAQPCETYELLWEIATACEISSDTMAATFFAIPTMAIAGNDTTITDENLVITLNANIPDVGSGQWSILAGEGGTFSDATNPHSEFTAQNCETYELLWEISTACEISTDTVLVEFFTLPTEAYAGEDQLGLEGTWTNLAANTPEIGSGYWAIISGEGGQITNPDSPTSVFLGQNMMYYVLEWRISTICDTARDEVQIAFGFTPFQGCGDSLVDTRDGQKYATVQIGEQCWMAENLNNGVMINTPQPMEDNGLLEKYCFDNSLENCNQFGGLYTWGEFMDYDTIAGSQGICPEGWHIPIDLEWKILEGLADSQYDFGDPEWDTIDFWRGYDAGQNLKSSTFWDGTDLYGFNAVNSGRLHIGYSGWDWVFRSDTSLLACSSKQHSRILYSGANEIGRSHWGDTYAVRCIFGESPNNPPSTINYIHPADSAQNISINTTHSWSCSDPENDPLAYDVYFGTELTPPQVATGIADTFYTPGTLEYATTYYWQIVAHDDHGNTTEGEVWSFTTEFDGPYMPMEGLSGWWPFNGNADDASGNGLNGVVHGATLSVDRYGNEDEAYYFNGENNYIDLVNTFFNGNTNVTEVTYSVWVKINEYGDFVLSGKEGFWRTIIFSIGDDGQFRLHGTSQNNYFGVNSLAEVPLNTWNNLVVTFDNGVESLYLNGSLVNSETTTVNSLDYSYYAAGNSTATNYIGAIHPVNPGITNYFKGYMDDFAIWGRVLSIDEIQGLFSGSNK